MALRASVAAWSVLQVAAAGRGAETHSRYSCNALALATLTAEQSREIEAKCGCEAGACQESCLEDVAAELAETLPAPAKEKYDLCVSALTGFPALCWQAIAEYSANKDQAALQRCAAMDPGWKQEACYAQVELAAYDRFTTAEKALVGRCKSVFAQGVSDTCFDQMSSQLLSALAVKYAQVKTDTTLSAADVAVSAWVLGQMPGSTLDKATMDLFERCQTKLAHIGRRCFRGVVGHIVADASATLQDKLRVFTLLDADDRKELARCQAVQPEKVPAEGCIGVIEGAMSAQQKQELAQCNNGFSCKIAAYTAAVSGVEQGRRALFDRCLAVFSRQTSPACEDELKKLARQSDSAKASAVETSVNELTAAQTAELVLQGYLGIVGMDATETKIGGLLDVCEGACAATA